MQIPKKTKMMTKNLSLMMVTYLAQTVTLMSSPRQGKPSAVFSLCQCNSVCNLFLFLIRVNWKKTGKKKKKSEKVDLYELLGLENVRWMATDEQVKSGM